MSEIDEFKQHIKEVVTTVLVNTNKMYIEAKENGDKRVCEGLSNLFINQHALYSHGIFNNEMECRIDITGYEIFKDGLAHARIIHPEIFEEGDRLLAKWKLNKDIVNGGELSKDMFVNDSDGLFKGLVK